MDATIEKLNDKNYRSWALRMRGLLAVRGLSSVIEEKFQIGDEKGPAMDEKCRGYLVMCMDDKNLNKVEDCETAREMWIKLETYKNGWISRNQFTQRIRYRQKESRRKSRGLHL